jgi:cytochrome c553
MKRLLLMALGLTLAAGLIGLTAAAGGLPSMSAANGHWSVTERLVRLTKRRSVAMRGRTRPPVALADEALVARGAGHFLTACQRCHGLPGSGPPLLLREMVPQPPDLLRVRDRYSPGELFHIVKHGFKLSGMPGWPSQRRDDEVWAMVAFLEALPSLGAAGYARISAAPVVGDAVPPIVAAQCVRCHGADGMGRVAGAFPVLAGQHAAYLYESLRAFAYGARYSGIMMSVAGQLSDAEMRQAAGYYSTLPGLTAQPSAPVAGEGAGEDVGIMRAGLRSREVPSCAACHAQQQAINPSYPRLAGQYRRYLTQQLQLFAERRRGGTAYANVMHHVVDELPDEARPATVEYFGAR